MPDQAYDLRQLATHRQHAREGVRHRLCEAPSGPFRQTVPGTFAGRPALLAVAGGKGGVGTTTVALGLARALARTGKRIMLVDADARGGDAAMLCGIEERSTLANRAGRPANPQRGCSRWAGGDSIGCRGSGAGTSGSALPRLPPTGCSDCSAHRAFGQTWP